MATKKAGADRRSRPASRKKRTGGKKKDAKLDANLQPPREVALGVTDGEREELRERARYHETGPELTGGDVDADWERAASSGEEAVGGTVATPDQDVVDQLGDALGVHRAADEPLRASSEMLDARDRHRARETD